MNWYKFEAAADRSNSQRSEKLLILFSLHRVLSTMRHFTALLAVLLAVFFSLSHCHRWSPLPAHGEPCTVRNPARCEEPEAVEETVEPATEEDGFG